MSIKARIILTLSFLVFLIIAIGGYSSFNANSAITLLTDVSLADAQNEKELIEITLYMEKSRSQLLLG